MATEKAPLQQTAGDNLRELTELASEALRKWEAGDQAGAFQAMLTALPVASAAGAALAVLCDQDRRAAGNTAP